MKCTILFKEHFFKERLMMKVLITLMCFFVSIPALAQTQFNAQKVQQIGVFDDWGAYLFQDKKEKVCYVAAQPSKSAGEYNRRGDVFLMVSHRPTENIYDVVTVLAGYTYKPRSDALLRVGNMKQSLFTNRDTAWTRNQRTDEEIVRAMGTGIRATVRGVSLEGVETYDTFSLKGFTDALDAVNRLCRQPEGPKQ